MKRVKNFTGFHFLSGKNNFQTLAKKMASKPRAYPVSFIKDQLVPRAGKAALLAGGKLLKEEDEVHRVYLAYETSHFGTVLKDRGSSGLALSSRSGSWSRKSSRTGTKTLTFCGR